MKKRLALFLAASMVLTLLAGCGSTSSSSSAVSSGAASSESASSEGTPVSGGTLTLSLSSSPKNLDPIKYTGVYESQIIINVCDTLVAYKMDLSEIVPSLAESWKVSDDGKVYDFKLRDDVYFQPGQYQDGRKMTAEDVKYSLERSAKESSMNRLDMLDHVEVVSDTEVKCYLNSTNAAFMTALTDAGNVIVPKEEVEGWGDDFGSHLVGTGAFSLKEFKQDQESVCERNDKYWGSKPYLDGVTFKVITDGNQAANALKTGEIDYATNLTGEAIQLVHDDSNLNLLETPGLHIAYLYMNQVNGPTKDKKVRQAIMMAIDRSDLVKGVYQYNEAQEASIPLPPGSWGYDKNLESEVPQYNPTEAKKLLTEAGYPDGLTLDLYISNTAARVKMATIVQQYLKTNLNITLNIHTSEWGTFSEMASSGNADMYGMSWTWYPDPYFFLNKLFASSEIGALGNGAGFKNDQVDTLLNEALAETDQAKRAESYKEALKLIVEDDPIFVYANENVTDGSSKKVHGMVQRSDQVIKICNSEVNVWKEQ